VLLHAVSRGHMADNHFTIKPGDVAKKVARAMARGHMGRAIRPESGAARTYWGPSAYYSQKWVFYSIIGFFLINMAIISRIIPFLGDIGHFWRPDSWRKLGM
jgi:hypothetical protein